MRSSIHKGDVVFVDPTNCDMNKVGYGITAQVIDIKGTVFKKYKCISLQTQKTFVCNRKMIVKVPSFDGTDHVILRFPDDTPTFTDSDVAVMKDVVEALGSKVPRLRDINTDALNILYKKILFFSMVNEI